MPSDPTTVPNLLAWYGRAGYSAGVWTDRSGSGFNTSSVSAPATDSSTYYDACPSSITNGATKLTMPAGVALNQNNFAMFTRFWLNRPQPNTTYATGLFFMGISPFLGLWIQPDFSLYSNPVHLPIAAYPTVSGVLYANVGDNIISMRSNGSRGLVTVNGVSTSTAAFSSQAYTGGTIGWFNALDSITADGTFAEMIFYSQDVTDGQAITVTNWLKSGRGYIPPALSVNPLVLCDGNSLTVGLHASSQTTVYPAVLKTLLGSGVNVSNQGISGRTTAAMLTEDLTRVDPIYERFFQKNIYVFWEGTNDLYFGATAATAYANTKSCCLARKAAGYNPVLILTVLDRSDAGTPGGFDTSRTTYNNSLRADFPNATSVTSPVPVFTAGAGVGYGDYLVDVAADATIGATGAQLNTTYFFTDQVHMVDAGYSIIANAVYQALLLKGVLTAPVYSRRRRR